MIVNARAIIALNSSFNFNQNRRMYNAAFRCLSYFNWFESIFIGSGIIAQFPTFVILRIWKSLEFLKF